MNKDWVLVDEKTGEHVEVGDNVTTFRGESGILTYLEPPNKLAASGKVHVKFDEAYTGYFYASVIGCKFIQPQLKGE